MTDFRDDDLDERLLLLDDDDFDFSASAQEAKATADAAHFAEQLTLILGGHQEMKGLVRRLETLIAEQGRKDAKRDAALAKRLLTADELTTAAHQGANAGAEAAGKAAAQRLNQVSTMVETINRRIEEEERRRAGERVWWIQAVGYLGGGAAIASLVIGVMAFQRGGEAGEAHGYAAARDEAAAASWANTSDGRFARNLFESGMLAKMRSCTGKGWVSAKVKGGWVCYGGHGSEGWFTS